MTAHRSTAAPRPDRYRARPLQLLALPLHPDTVLPQLTERQGPLSLLGFPAASGVFVAYMVAKALAPADQFGFAAVTTGVLVVGALMGMVVLWFIGMMPEWSAADSDSSQLTTDRMFALFSHATWPFLPLAAVVIGIDYFYNGTAMFSDDRPGMPTALALVLHTLILGTMVLWLVTMVRGTAVVRQESSAEAARDLIRWGAEFLLIAVLFAVAVGASVAYW